MPVPKKNFGSFIVNSDAAGAAEYMYEIYASVYKSRRDGTYGEQQEIELKAVEDFMKEITLDENRIIPVEKRAFLEAFMNKVSEMYYEGVVRLGKKRDEWEQKILEGKVPDTELIKDEPETVKKIAHDIVLETDLDANVLPDMLNKLSEWLTKKRDDTRKYVPDGGGDEERCIIDDINDDNRNKTIEKYKISQDKFSEYAKGLMDRNPSTSTGYKVKSVVKDDDVFEEVPEYVRETATVTTLGDLEDYESTIYETLHQYKRHEMRVKASTETAAALLKELDEVAAEADKTEDFNAVRKALEEYTHLGKDYRFDDSLMPEKAYSHVTDAISFVVLENAEKKLEDPISKYDELLDEMINADGKQVSQHIKDLAKTVRKINNFTFAQRNTLDDYKKNKVNIRDVEECEKKLKYVRKFRKIKKYPGWEGDMVAVGYEEKDLDILIEKLSANLVNDGVNDSSYDKLIVSMMHYRRRINSKRNYGGLSPEELDEINKKIDDNRKEIINLINECREFEKTNEIRLNLTGKNPDRILFLGRIEDNLNGKITMEADNFPDLWGAQENDRDILWLGTTYSYKNLLKDKGHLIDEEDRQRYGFNQNGSLSKVEEDRLEMRVKSLVQDCLHEKTFKNYTDLIENFSRNMIRMSVNAGKNYESVYKALEGVEDRELKARYLFNYGGGRIEYGANDPFKEEIKSCIMDMGENNALPIDIYDTNLTFDELFTALGFNEEEKKSVLNVNDAPLRADGKVMDFFKEDAGKEWKDQPLTDEVKKRIEKSAKSNLKIYVSDQIYDVYIRRGAKKEISTLSVKEKKYYDSQMSCIDDPEKKKEHRNIYEPIQNWINETGEALSDDLCRVMVVDQIQRTHAVLGKLRLMGIDPKTEIGRFNHYYVKQENEYIGLVLKEGKSAKEVCDKIIKDGKYRKLINISPKKRPVNYETYIELHTGGRAGNTPEEMMENFAKCMSAVILGEPDQKPDISGIHKGAKYIKDLYAIETLKQKPEMLREALRSAESVRRAGFELRNAIYGIKEDQIQSYCDDMDKLHTYMMSDSKRSAKYKKLYAAVKSAAEINTKNVTAEEKLKMIRKANIDIFKAVKDYTEGKEKVRSTDDGNARFENALDALAVASKYATGMEYIVKKYIHEVNTKRNNNNPEHESYINADSFTARYGAENARSKSSERALAKSAKNKVQNKALSK